MSSIANIALYFGNIVNRGAVSHILNTNAHSRKYGLQLTETQAVQILAARDETLRRVGRVELGNQVINRIITVFSTSPYINQAEYADTICELLDIFYYMKNESLDEVPDDELIDMMKDYFDRTCLGSIDLLAGRELEIMAREIRFGQGNLEPGSEKEV